jgi:hypothetical protein
VHLAGGSYEAFGEGVATAGVSIAADGNVYFLEDGFGGGQINPSTDWIRPASAVNSPGFDVRVSASTTTGLHPGNPPLNTWLSLSATRTFANVSNSTITFTVEIRNADTLAVIATGQFTCTATAY